jgi:hypothetical protein
VPFLEANRGVIQLSNVLIGIIGVILFIGLALAGALILGDDFKSANSSSKAAALVAQMKQASDATEMYRLKTGKANLPVTSVSMLMPRFLKSMPVNPSPSATSAASAVSYFWSIRYDNNIYPVNVDENNYVAKFLIAPIGDRYDERARAICQAMNESLGVPLIEEDATGGDPIPGYQTGCLLGLGDAGPGRAQYYIAYTKIAPMSQDIRLAMN